MIPASLREDRRSRRDLAISLAGLALLLWWEVAGWDLPLAQWYGGTGGFALRHDWWTQRLLHDGGRMLSGAVLIAAVLLAWRAPASGRADARARRYATLVLVGGCLLLVPLLKHFSRTSCPWDLEPFGGSAPYVPHWMLNLADGGPGHCFPSGHAVAAFAFLPLYFHWRARRPTAARASLALVLGFGTLFGWAQLARGAHFPSHTLWSAWLCWVLSAAGARLLERHGAPRVRVADVGLVPAPVSAFSESELPAPRRGR